MTIAGWGITDASDPSSTPDRMQSADVPVLSDEQCKLGEFGSHYICAGSGGITGCFGDSGGPLFYTLPDGSFVQMGSTHGGPACGGPYIMFMDLNDADIIQFIDATLKGKKSPYRIPEEPCPDYYGEDTYLENWGEPVETEDGHLLRAEFSGRCADEGQGNGLHPGDVRKHSCAPTRPVLRRPAVCRRCSVRNARRAPLRGTVCADVPWDVFETTMSENSKLSADLKMFGSGMAGVGIGSCDQDWNCEWTETVEIDDTGAASVSWTNCELDPRTVVVVVEHRAGEQTMNYELAVNAQAAVGAC